MAPFPSPLPLSLLVALFLALSVASSWAATGVDVSVQDCEAGAITYAGWQCLVGKGFSFAVIEVFQGGAFQINSKIKSIVSDAYRAGIKMVDLYVFMCPNCRNNADPSAVIERIYNATRSVRFNRLWFDIELCEGQQCWFDPATNLKYIQQAVAKAQSMGFRVGIYSQNWEWANTFPPGTTTFKNLPLWYANWDGKQTFADWTGQFGGWAKPTMKQYKSMNDNSLCMHVDLNWFPGDAVMPPLPSLPAEPDTPLADPVNMKVPMVHQLWDTPDWYNGAYGCGPTSSVMAIAYFGRLPAKPITCSQPTPHTNNYGWYIPNNYTLYGTTFNYLERDPWGNVCGGAFGWCTSQGVAWAKYMITYIQHHNLTATFGDNNSVQNIKAALDRGCVVVLSTYLSSVGHIIVVRGYDTQGNFICNDPWGNKLGGSWGNKLDGEGVRYSWSLLNAAGGWRVEVSK